MDGYCLANILWSLYKLEALDVDLLLLILKPFLAKLTETVP